jgi:hypothetical protein
MTQLGELMFAAYGGRPSSYSEWFLCITRRLVWMCEFVWVVTGLWILTLMFSPLNIVRAGL